MSYQFKGFVKCIDEVRELKKRELEMNKHGRVVSKVKMITATMDNNFIKNRGTKFPLITNEIKSK